MKNSVKENVSYAVRKFNESEKYDTVVRLSPTLKIKFLDKESGELKLYYSKSEISEQVGFTYLDRVFKLRKDKDGILTSMKYEGRIGSIPPERFWRTFEEFENKEIY